jgi:hypothetical protein
LFITGALAATGCGAANLAMRGPISSQCKSAGLQACPELTDGVMEYVGGDHAAAEPKLRAAVAANTPEKVRLFAAALEPIAANIGGDAGAAMTGVIALLLGTGTKGTELATVKASGTGGTSASGAAGGEPGVAAAAAHLAAVQRQPPNVVVEELRAGSERPATDPRKATCGGLLGSDPKCVRVRVAIGPLVLTNAYTSGGCPDELILLAGSIDKPHWLLLSPAGAAMNVSGQIILEDGEELFAVTRAVGAAPPKDDVKCFITWSGFKPISMAGKKYDRFE